MDRKMVQKGDFLTSGPPAAGQSLTKVFVCESVADFEAADRHFEQVQKAIELTRKALETLKGGSK
jgi:hypothetical protein